MQPSGSKPRDDHVMPASANPLRVVATQPSKAARREALRALHADLARSEKTLEDLLKGLRGKPGVADLPTPKPAPRARSFVVADESAVWAGAVASAARAASRLGSPGPLPGDVEGSA